VFDKKPTWRLVLPIALLALVIGTTLGGIWHHHVNAPADNCPICHLNHQALEPAPVSIRVCTPLTAESRPEPQQDNFAPHPAIRRIPVRGPPA
jgi:hypothetical protein